MGRSETGNSHNPDSSVNRGRKPTSNKRKSSTAQYECLYHGNNTTHNTNQCKVMKAQASRMASSHEDRGGRHKYRRSDATEGNSYQKTQNKKKYESFLADLARHVTKKRKTSDDRKRSSKVKNEQFSIEEFNYEQFRDLQVSSSDQDTSSNHSDSS